MRMTVGTLGRELPDHGFVNPRQLEEMWRDQFDWVYREYDYAVFEMTIHPDVSGRPLDPLDPKLLAALEGSQP